MKIGSHFKSRFMKAADLPADRDTPAQIDCVTVEQMQEGSGEEKPCLWFVGKPQLLVLNKSNAQALSAALGDETDNWSGATVALFVVPTQKGPGIRLRVTAPPALAAAE